MAQINEWLSIDKTSGTGNDSVTLTALQNDGDERTIQLVVKGRYRTQYVNVTQEINPALLPKKYLWVKLEEDGYIQGLRTTFEYTYDLVNWNSCPSRPLSVPADTYVWFRNTSPILNATNAEERIQIDFTKRGSIGGNLSSMGDMRDYNFKELFEDNTYLVDASELILPWNILAIYCYQSMFAGCTSLTTTPVLPATTLAKGCYDFMFSRCTSLTTAPVLPATTLVTGCYSDMFYYCTSLVNAPVLPATTLADGCYSSMFYDCTSLTTTPALPATILADDCYSQMFRGCTSLVYPPELPAITLADGCYNWMFEGCTSLETAPALPATILAVNCYNGMFMGCTSLTIAPVLPATILEQYCYNEMFKSCTSLTTAPVLPATELQIYCYYQMFRGCSNLSRVECYAENIRANNCLYKWLEDVSSTGTFIKKQGITYPSGSSGIPSGWSVQEI